MAVDRKSVDWEKIESDYRTGIKSLRDIAADHDVSHVAISKRAKKFGWTKDLAAKIQAKADELVNKAIVNKSVSTEALVNERDVIAGVAATQAEVRTQQMIRATDSRMVIEGMIDELKLLNKSTDEDKPGLFIRVDSAKKLIESWAKAIEVERKVYGIVDKQEARDGRSVADYSRDELISIVMGDR